MNNYWKHQKKRKNKPYCNILKKEITFSRCRECVNKEYKTRINTNSVYNSEKYRKNGFFVTKVAKKRQTIAKSSKKLAKLEKNRYSVFTGYTYNGNYISNDNCLVCNSTYQLTWNEIYRGRNRINSMIHGFCLRMCLDCHRKYQDHIEFNDYWHRQGQIYWESNIGTREEFIDVFKRNYLE